MSIPNYKSGSVDFSKSDEFKNSKKSDLSLKTIGKEYLKSAIDGVTVGGTNKLEETLKNLKVLQEGKSLKNWQEDYDREMDSIDTEGSPSKWIGKKAIQTGNLLSNGIGTVVGLTGLGKLGKALLATKSAGPIANSAAYLLEGLNAEGTTARTLGQVATKGKAGSKAIATTLSNVFKGAGQTALGAGAYGGALQTGVEATKDDKLPLLDALKAIGWNAGMEGAIGGAGQVAGNILMPALGSVADSVSTNAIKYSPKTLGKLPLISPRASQARQDAVDTLKNSGDMQDSVIRDRANINPEDYVAEFFGKRKEDGLRDISNSGIVPNTSDLVDYIKSNPETKALYADRFAGNKTPELLEKLTDRLNLQKTLAVGGRRNYINKANNAEMMNSLGEVIDDTMNPFDYLNKYDSESRLPLNFEKSLDMANQLGKPQGDGSFIYPETIAKQFDRGTLAKVRNPLQDSELLTTNTLADNNLREISNDLLNQNYGGNYIFKKGFKQNVMDKTEKELLAREAEKEAQAQASPTTQQLKEKVGNANQSFNNVAKQHQRQFEDFVLSNKKEFENLKNELTNKDFLEVMNIFRDKKNFTSSETAFKENAKDAEAQALKDTEFSRKLDSLSEATQQKIQKLKEKFKKESTVTKKSESILSKNKQAEEDLLKEYDTPVNEKSFSEKLNNFFTNLGGKAEGVQREATQGIKDSDNILKEKLNQTSNAEKEQLQVVKNIQSSQKKLGEASTEFVRDRDAVRKYNIDRVQKYEPSVITPQGKEVSGQRIGSLNARDDVYTAYRKKVMDEVTSPTMLQPEQRLTASGLSKDVENRVKENSSIEDFLGFRNSKKDIAKLNEIEKLVKESENKERLSVRSSSPVNSALQTATSKRAENLATMTVAKALENFAKNRLENIPEKEVSSKLLNALQEISTPKMFRNYVQSNYFRD